MRTITYEDALRALNQAVADKGYNHVYERIHAVCYNVWEGKPDCIVGHALVYLGVPVEWFETDSLCNDGASDVCSALFRDDMFRFDDDAIELFRSAQDSQDNASTWGVSVTRAHLGEEWFASLGLYADVA